MQRCQVGSKLVYLQTGEPRGRERRGSGRGEGDRCDQTSPQGSLNQERKLGLYCVQWEAMRGLNWWVGGGWGEEGVYVCDII